MVARRGGDRFDHQLPLCVGPYQGPLGCLEIPFDRGVCGAAARLRATQLVDDGG
jgi:GAF domain-containing protein